MRCSAGAGNVFFMNLEGASSVTFVPTPSKIEKVCRWRMEIVFSIKLQDALKSFNCGCNPISTSHSSTALLISGLHKQKFLGGTCQHGHFGRVAKASAC
eukprot:2594344-Amphidinium_carterae.2